MKHQEDTAMINEENLIKIYYNLLLIVDMKEETYDRLIESDAYLTDTNFKLINSDLEQLDECLKNIEQSLNLTSASVKEKINSQIILDPYYILTKNILKTQGLLKNPTLKKDKEYIN